ncbi:MAG: YecA family protein [Streptosporangiaceae bacterium]
MSVTPLHSEEQPAWSADLHLHLSTSPLTLAELTDRLKDAHPELKTRQVERELGARGDVHETEDGWVSLLAVSDGAVLTHMLTEAERDTGVLAADGDLDLWARLADEGLGMEGGGEVRTNWVPDPGADALEAGEDTWGVDGDLSRFVGEALVGPEGWLRGFEPDELLALRLRDGTLEVTKADELEKVNTDDLARRSTQVIETCYLAAADALTVYSEHVGHGDEMVPAMPLDDALAGLLVAHPGVLDEPLPPLGILLQVAHLKVAAGWVALPGAPRDPSEVAGMSPQEIRTLTLARGLLRTHGDGEAPEETFRTFLGALTQPSVVGRLADHVELHGAGEPLLDAIGRAATSPVERASAVLLRARAAEGSGDSVTAERLVGEALEHDPGCEPALLDAADYAATRGESSTADAYLRRAGVPAHDALRHTLRHTLRAPAGAGSRNRPCPCGSGRKYKACCLRNVRHPLPVRAATLYARVATYAQRARGKELIEEYTAEAEPYARLIALDLAIFEGGLLDAFLHQRGAWLPDDERSLLRGWRETPLRAYEAAEVRPHVDVTLRALPDGERIRLPDRALSSDARRLDILCTRLLQDGEGPRVLALPLRVNRTRRQELLELLEDGYEPEDVMAFFGPQPPPGLRNREGHLLVACSASYDVPDHEAAWKSLAADLDEDGPNRLVATHELDDGESILRGFLRRERGRISVEANSVERLRDLQRRVLDAAPDARLVSESTVPMERLLAERDNDPAPEPAEDASGLPPEQAAELLDQVMRQHELRWVDDQIPALGGRTPREAVTEGGDALAELNVLLDDMEWRRDASGQGMDPARIRHDLGLIGQ